MSSMFGQAGTNGLWASVTSDTSGLKFLKKQKHFSDGGALADHTVPQTCEARNSRASG